MCGRFAITTAPELLRAHFGYADKPNFPPRYNIAPTQPIPIIRAERAADGGLTRRFMLARWGFLPGFVKDASTFPLLINARAETAAEKPSFRAAFRRRRCLIPADAYYEWRRPPKTAKRAAAQPFLIRRRDGAPMAFAGLFETYSGSDGSEIDTACILTTDANAATVAIHDRMPAIIEPPDFDLWLDPDETAAGAAARLLRPAADDALEFFEISPAVNKATHDGPQLQAPLGATSFV